MNVVSTSVDLLWSIWFWSFKLLTCRDLENNSISIISGQLDPRANVTLRFFLPSILKNSRALLNLLCIRLNSLWINCFQQDFGYHIFIQANFFGLLGEMCFSTYHETMILIGYCQISFEFLFSFAMICCSWPGLQAILFATTQMPKTSANSVANNLEGLMCISPL